MKSNLKTLTLAFALLSIGILLQALAMKPANAGETYSVRSLKGNYGFVANGFDGATTTPWVRAGILTFDGNGGCSLPVGKTKSGFGSVTDDPNPPCTYEVDSNGSVSISIGGIPRTFLVIVEHGKELLFIRTSPDSLNVSGVLKKQ